MSATKDALVASEVEEADRWPCTCPRKPTGILRRHSWHEARCPVGGYREGPLTGITEDDGTRLVDR